MVRDFELVRRILLEIQALPADSIPDGIRFDGEYSDRVVDEHVALLIDAGLLEGVVSRNMDGSVSVFVFRLTWEGHDFLDAAANDTIWKKARDVVLKPSVSFSFDLLKEWLKMEAKARLGLP